MLRNMIFYLSNFVKLYRGGFIIIVLEVIGFKVFDYKWVFFYKGLDCKYFLFGGLYGVCYNFLILLM